jgi:phosphoesterase RecJ-like protein
MIDHHEIGTPFAPGYIIKGASSAGEVLFTVVEELIAQGAISLDAELAYPLYASVSSDTGCFRYSNVTADTLRRAAALIETGIDAADINHRLFNAKTERQIRAEGYTAKNIKIAFGGKVAYSTVTKAERDELGVLMEHFETAIDIVRSVIGVEISFVIKETDKGEYKVSLRSTGADVAKISASFGGGGHIRAAGCTVEADGIESAARIVLDRIKNEYYKDED